MKKSLIINPIKESNVIALRGMWVILDFDLAQYFGVETRVLNQAVKRNEGRFPEDFKFQLTKAEFENLKSQNVISSSKHGGARSLPYAFTEVGCWTVSMILKSKKSEQVGKDLLRTFKLLRDMVQSHPGQLTSSSVQKLIANPQTTINVFNPKVMNIQVGNGNQIEQQFNNLQEVQELLNKLLPAVLQQDKILGHQVEKLVSEIKKQDKPSVSKALSVVANTVQVVSGIDPTITALKAALAALGKFL